MAITDVVKKDVAKLYVSAFGRAPDAEGFKFWLDSYEKGVDLYKMAMYHTQSEEYKKAYADVKTNADFVEKVYMNVLHRASDAEGKKFWVNALDKGMTKAAFLVDFIKGAQGDDVAQIANKADFGIYVAENNIPADNEKVQEQFKAITKDAKTLETAKNTVADLAVEVVEGETFTLTNEAKDIINGTAKSNLFDASKVGTLQTGDIIIDPVIGDSDILKATVTNESAKPRLQNIENLKITGEYVKTGIDLSDTVGSKYLELNTKIPSGTATVAGANTLNIEQIKAGSNIQKLSIASLASGTRDQVKVDANQANTVEITGVTAGADSYEVTLAKGASLELKTYDSKGDSLSVIAAGDFNLTTPAGTEVEVAIKANNEATVATLDDALAIAKKVTVEGSKKVVLATATGTALEGVEVVANAPEASIKVTGALKAAADFKKASVAKVELAKTVTDSLTLNENSELLLSKGFNLTANIDNAAADLTAGTLRVSVAQDQTALTTGAKVETLMIKATPDEVEDTKDGKAITLTTLTLNAATKNVIVQGAEDLKLTGVAGGADGLVIAANNMTGKLTVGNVAVASTINAGSGNDSITFTAAKAQTVYGNAGNDIINNAANTTASKLFGGAGDDKIMAGTAADAIDAGEGDDTVTLNTGASVVTLGAGADRVVAAAGNNGTIKDFVKGTDTLVLHGTATADVNLASLTAPVAGTYNIGGVNGVTLEGFTATDMSDSVQLGSLKQTFKANDTGTIIAGAKNDFIEVATTESATVGTGAGKDTVILNTGAGSAVVINDFSVGEDKVLIKGTLAAGNLDLTNITPAAGLYTINTDAKVTLKNGSAAFTGKDLTKMVQLEVTADAGGTMLTGGVFNDTFTLAGGVDTVNFIDNGGFDTVKSFTTGNDKLSFSKMTGMSSDAVQGIVIAAGAEKVANALEGRVYIFADGAKGTNGAKITNFTANPAKNVKLEDALKEVASFLDAGLTSAAGEKHVALIHAGSNKYYAYAVNGDADGIQADNVSLIGLVESTGALVAADIA